MCSLRNQLGRLICLGLLSGCSMFLDTPAEPVVAADPGKTSSVVFEAPVSGTSLLYQGGEVVVTATLTNQPGDSNSFTWRTGRAIVVDHGYKTVSDEVARSWVRLRWDTSAIKDTSNKKRSIDTIALIRASQYVGIVNVSIRNLLPVLDSTLVGTGSDAAMMHARGVNTDTISLAAHPGAVMYLKLRFRDIDSNYAARLRAELPMALNGAGSLAWQTGGVNDSVLVWRAPSTLCDTVIGLVESDEMGIGERVWHLRLSTYQEEGSVWAGCRTEIVKFGMTASGKVIEILRLRGFGEITALSIDPNREGGLIFGLDRTLRKIWKYTTDGLVRIANGSVNYPQALACNYAESVCWVADLTADFRHYRLAKIDGDFVAFNAFPDTFAVPTALAVDPRKPGRIWFVSRDSGLVGRITGNKLDTVVRGLIRRPGAVAFDESLSLLWISDLETRKVFAIDSQYRVVKTLSGFGLAASLSAAKGVLWVADPVNRTFSRWDTSGTRKAQFTGYDAQVVNIDVRHTDQAWALATSAGQLLRLQGDTLYTSVSSAGLDRPDVLVTHPGSQ
jgi:hypothetical protein